jgi:hypothetical protein
MHEFSIGHKEGGFENHNVREKVYGIWNTPPTLGAFAKFWKASISFVMPVRPFEWNNSAHTGWIFMKFYIWVFLTFHILDIINIVEIILRNCYITDDIHCVIIQTQRTQNSGRNSNGRKHCGGPPEDGREKRPKHVGILYLQKRF